MTKVCFFGTYEKGSLSETLKNFLEKENVFVDEFQKDVYSFRELIKAYFFLWKNKPKEQYPIVFVPWRGIISLPLAKKFFKNPIVFFPYVSIFDTLVNDRKKFSSNSIQAKFIKFIEKKACQMADLIVLENNEVIKYFSENYKIEKKKFRKLIWAADEKKFPSLPLKNKKNTFNVVYFGTFIPFHGVDVIIEAAKLLVKNSDIKFILCGKGQTKNENEKLVKNYGLKNVEFLGHVPFDELKDQIKDADVCLGVFGEKNRRTDSFPNKISQVLASQRALITRDVPVMREMLLNDKENCILTEAGNPQSLADAILFLKENYDIIENIAKNGYITFKKITKESWDEFWNETINPIIEKSNLNKT